MEIKLPKLGEGADSGVLVTVFVKEGDTIAKDQPILELENEKAIAAIPSPAAGVVVKVHVKPGDKLSTGQRILTLSDSRATTHGGVPEPTKTPAAAAVPSTAPSTAGARREPVPEPQLEYGDEAEASGTPPSASPTIRHLAKELGIDLAKIRGSARGGRVVLADLRTYIGRLEKLAARAAVATSRPPAGPAATVDFAKWGPVTIKPLSPLRQTIMRRMGESWSQVPRVTQFDEADATWLLQLRERYKAAYETKGTRLTLTAFLLPCLVQALRQHPNLNSSLDPAGEHQVVKGYYHLGVAVDTEAGLIVPVIRDVDKKNLIELSRELAELARRARERKVTAEDLQGGTFTLSNQGGIGGAHFTPIVNRPEVAILGVGRGSIKPVWRGGQFEPRHLLPLALSYDHRLVDGAEAARFIVDLGKAIEGFDEATARL
jgi:pyruvate dehydrogenase E2 component (dihydrolipoamide acetyltransferase)